MPSFAKSVATAPVILVMSGPFIQFSNCLAAIHIVSQLKIASDMWVHEGKQICSAQQMCYTPTFSRMNTTLRVLGTSSVCGHPENTEAFWFSSHPIR